MTFKKATAISLFVLVMLAASGAEAFRTKKTVLLDTNEGVKKVGVNDAFSVSLPKDLTFVQGIEIQVKIPQAIALYPDTTMFSIYGDLNNTPSANRTNYSGKEIFSALYPGLLSWSIVVPLSEENTIKKSPYSVKTPVVKGDKGFVFFRNQLAMKGLPETSFEAEFEVSARPVFFELGAIKITLSPNESDYTLIVDEKNAKLDKDGMIFLKPGRHSVSVVSKKFRNEVRLVMVEQAKVTELAFDLKSVEPVFVLRAPQGTRVFVDDSEVLDIGALRLEDGSHIFRFTLGGYEVTKNVEIQSGKNYEISVNFDASVFPMD